LYALSFREVFTPDEAAASLRCLDDGTFWVGDAQVEIMQLITSRWAEFKDEDCSVLEARVRAGVPGEVFPPDAFDNDEWTSIHDSKTFRRLQHIAATGEALGPESLAAVDQIAARHPKWVASPGDRDDFNVWHEGGDGPDGHPDLLPGIPDDRLVQQAMRLQKE
jgi:hypothetical protein